MADILVTASNVKPINNNGLFVRREIAAGTLTVGDVVYIDGTGKAQRAQANAIGTTRARGIVIGVGAYGATGATAAAGETVDLLLMGALYLAPTVALTPGGELYVSAVTAGKMDQTAPATTGQFKWVIGYADSANVVIVNPAMIVAVANP